MSRRRKDSTYVFGQVISVGEIQEYQIRERNHKRVICGIQTKDKQKLYIEFRDEQVDRLKEINIQEGDYIETSIFFNGIEKSGKYFNNLVVQSFNYVN
jgi:translation initiation factor IF-1